MTGGREQRRRARTAIAVLLLSLLPLLSGCVVQSLTPFYAEGAVADLPGLEGRWRLVMDAGEAVTRPSSRPWIIGDHTVSTFEDGVGSVLRVVYFRIGETTFVDITAHTPAAGQVNRWWVFHVVPVHSVCKLVRRGDRLILYPLDPDWLDRLPGGLPRIRPMQGEDLTVYYPSPARWMRLLAEHRQDARAFPAEGRYELQRLPGAAGG